MMRAHLRSKIVAVREYLEVSKPRIVVVLVITAVTSMLAASRFDNTPEVGWDISMWNLLFLIISGTLASAGSSALNHYYDRDIDKVMPRTSKRPIPSGKLLPQRVLFFGLLLCVVSVSIAVLTLNLVSAAMIALGIFIYVVVYTIWLKRNNPSNIVIGGFAGSAAFNGRMVCSNRLYRPIGISGRIISILMDTRALLVFGYQSSGRIWYSKRSDASCVGRKPKNCNIYFLQYSTVTPVLVVSLFLWARSFIYSYSSYRWFADVGLPL